MKTIVTKAQFAELRGVGPSAVSNWIKEGKITEAALQGSGVRARIWVEQANEDLKRSLDPSQQASRPLPPSVSSPPTSPSGAANDDEDLRRRRKADADKAEHDAEAARRRLAVDEGRWLDAASGAREWGRELSKFIADAETFFFTTVARDIGEKHGLDWKLVSVRMRDLWRQHRTSVADEAKHRLAAHEQALAEAAE